MSEILEQRINNLEKIVKHLEQRLNNAFSQIRALEQAAAPTIPYGPIGIGQPPTVPGTPLELPIYRLSEGPTRGRGGPGVIPDPVRAFPDVKR